MGMFGVKGEKNNENKPEDFNELDGASSSHSDKNHK